MTEESNFWRGLPKVVVTAEHIDRALRAMQSAVPDLTHYEIDHEAAVLAGAVIAHMEAFDERVQFSELLAVLAEEVLSNYLVYWMESRYGLLDPRTEDFERALRERAERNLARAEKARAAREAKRNAEVEAAVTERLATATSTSH